jgi:hypothetical protein
MNNVVKPVPDIFSSDQYLKRTSNGQTGRECVVCGKQVKPGPSVPYCRANVSGEAIAVGAEIDAAEDMGCFPVGSDCARRFPPGYLIELELLP